MGEKANPAPLGLLGFGMTTVLLNIHNTGIYPLGAMILAMGLAYGGLAQVIAGAMEFKKGNTFGTLAFSSYGLFWWSLVILLLLPNLTLLSPTVISPNETAMAPVLRDRSASWPRSDHQRSLYIHIQNRVRPTFHVNIAHLRKQNRLLRQIF